MDKLRDIAAQWLACAQPTILVEVTEALGSVPREAGTRMLVSATQLAGTIGGGHLELKAIERARRMLEHPFGLSLSKPAASEAEAPFDKLRVNGISPQTAHYPLGPSLGQCCGGAVTLGFSALDAKALAAWPREAPRFHLQLYGAGHVGRAIVQALLPLPVRVDWIDEREEEFPADVELPAHIRKVCVEAVEAEVKTAPRGAFYLVLTHQHDLDLRIAEAILQRGDFGYFGLIGSKTKRQRFIHRFEQRGIAPQAIARMTCPIGLPGIAGKEPAVIAASVVAQLLQAAEARSAQADGAEATSCLAINSSAFTSAE